MIKKLILPVLITAMIGTMVGCNKSSDDYTYEESSSVLVSKFYLTNNSKILDSLSNVYFSIDLVHARIFNADSLPYGTKITRLVPSITVATNASSIELKFRSSDTGRDSIVDYRANPTDSIDFSQGPVKLTVVSQNGLVKRDYEIRVNVHKQKADSMMWYSLSSAPMPTAFTQLKDQRTAELGGTYYCLTTDGSTYCVATTTDPANPNWETEGLRLPFVARVNSLRSSTDALYMLSSEGELYTSTDCRNWTSTGLHWHYIYGGYGADILGCTESPYVISSYPSGKTWAMPSGFPVDGTSVPATYTVPMGLSTQLVMVGGRCSDGTLCAGAWGFDGNEWAMVSNKELPTALHDVTLVPYYLVEVPNTTWAPYDYPVLLAFGGRNKQDAINRTVYYSRDWGMTWSKAPEQVQLPDEVPTFYGASAFTYTSTLHISRSASWWTELPLIHQPKEIFTGSRATAPISQWECPAIYLFGGRDYDGNTLNTLWRGVILQFTYVPVQ